MYLNENLLLDIQAKFLFIYYYYYNNFSCKNQFVIYILTQVLYILRLEPNTYIYWEKEYELSITG